MYMTLDVPKMNQHKFCRSHFQFLPAVPPTQRARHRCCRPRRALVPCLRRGRSTAALCQGVPQYTHYGL